MLDADLEKALNDHLGAELYAAHLYLAMSAYCESMNLPGSAEWFRIQGQEEQGHAMRFYRYIIDRGGRVVLPAIPEPPSEFGTPLEVFEQSLEREREVTGRIQDLYATAASRKDYATHTFLQWFITEQVEEEAEATRIVESLRMIGEDRSALLLLDRELGTRQAGGK